jgi:hypothetical protein
MLGAGVWMVERVRGCTYSVEACRFALGVCLSWAVTSDVAQKGVASGMCGTAWSCHMTHPIAPPTTAVLSQCCTELAARRRVA